MEAIFHEKQEGSLCAQHCLNTLLQGPYFTAVDLAAIAQHLDEEERRRMAEGDTESEEYRKFLEQPSSNMDDSGFFSIQVPVTSQITCFIPIFCLFALLFCHCFCLNTMFSFISCIMFKVICNALTVWGLDLVPYSSPAAQDARKNPQNQQAFICNLQQHWFTLRKLGNQWFNINSLKTEPELVSETYLSMYLTQLQAEGYSIFVVHGKLPECEADQLLRLCPALPHKKPAPRDKKTSHQLINKADLSSALRDMGNTSQSSAEPAKPVDLDDVRRKRAEYFEKRNKGGGAEAIEHAGSSTNSNAMVVTDQRMSEMTEDEMLQAALSLSLQGQS
ncbi:ataxin-3 isoform X1 [Nematostella vectensis]|uniref:ataxin-3 isoform X1 n=1 Tax=Nematostella vectensis TaxID=45351 RepID=UPI0020774817|nr:ataxin-3 isoform X1 [Nematostella vectensis]